MTVLNSYYYSYINRCFIFALPSRNSSWVQNEVYLNYENLAKRNLLRITESYFIILLYVQNVEGAFYNVKYKFRLLPPQPRLWIQGRNHHENSSNHKIVKHSPFTVPKRQRQTQFRSEIFNITNKGMARLNNWLGASLSFACRIVVAGPDRTETGQLPGEASHAAVNFNSFVQWVTIPFSTNRGLASRHLMLGVKRGMNVTSFIFDRVEYSVTIYTVLVMKTSHKSNSF